jgi:hypothetical protein
MLLYRTVVYPSEYEQRPKIAFNSVPTSQEYPVSPLQEAKRLILFRETVAFYCKNHTKHINAFRGQKAKLFNVLADGICKGSSHCVLNY